MVTFFIVSKIFVLYQTYTLFLLCYRERVSSVLWWRFSELEIGGTVQAVWAGLTYAEYAAFAEFMVSTATAETDTEQFIAACVFATIVAMTRGQTTTEAWIASRAKSLAVHIPAIAQNSCITRPIMEGFNTLYSRERLKTIDVTQMIYVLYAIASHVQIPPLQWMLEQAAWILVTIAGCASTGALFNYRFLLNEFGIPENDFVSAVKMAFEVIRNPFIV